jgi:hypothetical protein
MSRSNFSNWVDQQKNTENEGDEDESGESSTIFGQLNSIHNNFTNQLSELSGSLPDAPLNEAFRTRVKHSIYLLGIPLFILLPQLTVSILLFKIPPFFPLI